MDLSSYVVFNISCGATDFTVQVTINNSTNKIMGTLNKLSKSQLTNYVNNFSSVTKFVKFNCNNDIAKSISEQFNEDVVLIK